MTVIGNAERDGARHPRIAIVGAGFAGLGTAVRLRQAGIEDFVVLEKADEVGGTWQANTYPGCQCDVPSHLYSFSFAPNAGWTHTFSGQAEIWSYLKRVADEYGLREKVELGVELVGAEWLPDDQLWLLQTSQGLLTAEILVSGMGALAEPAIPGIDGLASFAGSCFHSARWDHDVTLAGKRVAVIGTGASAIQIVPKIQPEVAELHVFQRTPPWIIAHPDRAISDAERRLYKYLPEAQRLMREGIYWGRELYVLPFLHPLLAKPVEWNARRHLAEQVPDPELRATLTPTYRIGCKRILLSDDYYPAIECQIAYLMDCIATMERERTRSVEPKAEAQDAFLAEMRRRAKGTVWSSGGCASWYLDAEGHPSAIWPGPTWRFRRKLRRFRRSEYLCKPQTLPGVAAMRENEPAGGPA